MSLRKARQKNEISNGGPRIGHGAATLFAGKADATRGIEFVHPTPSGNRQLAEMIEAGPVSQSEPKFAESRPTTRISSRTWGSNAPRRAAIPVFAWSSSQSSTCRLGLVELQSGGVHLALETPAVDPSEISRSPLTVVPAFEKRRPGEAMNASLRRCRGVAG
jgi:hypothetical protein